MFGFGIFICSSPNTDFCYSTGMNERSLLCSHIHSSVFEERLRFFIGTIIHGIKMYYIFKAGFCIAQTVRVFETGTGVIV